MRSFFANIKKELLLLIRDWIGLIFLFFMPVVLVLLMTILQDSTMKKLNKEKIDIILINQDTSVVGNAIQEGLIASEAFNVFYTYNGDTLNLEKAKTLVKNGVFDFILVIPEKSTKKLRKIIANEILKQQPLSPVKPVSSDILSDVDFQIYFNPIIKGSFRQSIISSIHELIANVQTQIVFKAYTKFVESINGKVNKDNYPVNKIIVSETQIGTDVEKSIPNSSQHNVPAWTVFAIFFIVVPLSGQIISERNEGVLLRLKTLPVNFVNFLFSRILVYSLIAVLQAILLLFIGFYLLPVLGLPKLTFEGHIIDILLFTFVIGLAATSYGILIAVVAKTQHQAAIFGSVSIVILAAIGGIFVPTYIMSNTMQTISSMSPLNWALNGYYDIFLNRYSLRDLFPETIKLLFIFVFSLSFAICFDKPEK